MDTTAQRPLRPGTVISYADMEAIVVCDHGVGSLDVTCEGTRQKWHWSLDGESCKVVSVPRGQLAYENFEDYVRDFPEAEGYRAWLTNSGRNGVTLLKLVDPPHEGSPHGGVPGNYLWLSMFSMRDGSLRIAAHDCDDGLMVRDFGAEQATDARQVIQDLTALAPFSMWDAAKAYDFNWK